MMPLNAPLPLTWDEADTITDVIARQTEPGNTGEIKACGAYRLAVYYRMPIINLLMKCKGLSQAEAEEVTQDFLLRLETPLLEGNYKGFAKKVSIRGSYTRGAKKFRAYLAACVLNHYLDMVKADEKRRFISYNDEQLKLAESQLDVDMIRETMASLATESGRPQATADAVQYYRDEYVALMDLFEQEKVIDGAKTAQRIRTLRMAIVDGKNQLEIAQEIGATDRTVRNHMESIVAEFRDWLLHLVSHRLPSLSGVSEGNNIAEEIAKMGPLFERMDPVKRACLCYFLGYIGTHLKTK